MSRIYATVFAQRKLLKVPQESGVAFINPAAYQQGSEKTGVAEETHTPTRRRHNNGRGGVYAESRGTGGRTRSVKPTPLLNDLDA